MPLRQGRDEKKLPLTSPPQKQQITSSRGDGQVGFPERLKPSCTLLCLVLDPILLGNATQTRNSFPPGEFTKHKEQKADMGDTSCRKQSSVARPAVSRRIQGGFY